MTNFNARTIFSWVELEHQRKHFTTRDSLIEILTTKYGESQYASAASRLYTGTGTSESSGEKAYKAVTENIKTFGFEVQKPKLLEISNIFNHEDVAPRALYAIGIHFEEGARYDSAVYYYNRVVREYPFSRYAEALRPRLAIAVRPQVVKTSSTLESNVNDLPMQMDPVNANSSIPPLDSVGTIKGVPLNNSNGINLTPGSTPPVKKDAKK